MGPERGEGGQTESVGVKIHFMHVQTVVMSRLFAMDVNRGSRYLLLSLPQSNLPGPLCMFGAVARATEAKKHTSSRCLTLAPVANSLSHLGQLTKLENVC